MGWDATFRNFLDDPDASGLQVAVVLGPTTSPTYGGPADSEDITWTNYDPPAGGYRCLGSRCAVSGASLDPVDWTTTASRLVVDVVNEQAVRDAIDAGVHRGTLVEVWVTLPGDDPSTDAYRVWLGRLQQLESVDQWGGRTTYTMTAYGVQSLLANRRVEIGTVGGTTEALAGGDALFVSSGESGETYLTANFVVGVSTALSVNDASTFVFESSATGICELDDGTNVFYLEYTATGAGSITLSDTTGRFGTTSANMSSGTGSKVRPIAYMKGHPLDILRKVLMSTGAGTNGANDVYPSTWGLAIPSTYVNSTNIGAWKTNVVDSTMVLHLLKRKKESNAWAWLASWLQDFGIAVVLYEGDISVRCAQDVDDVTPELAEYSIGAKAVRTVKWKLVDDRHTYEKVTLDADASGATFTDFPGGSAKSSLLYTNPGGGWTVLNMLYAFNQGPSGSASTIEADVRDRRWHYYCGIAERYDFTIAHKRPATMCVGDLTNATTTMAFGIEEADSSTDTLSQARVIVVDGPDLDWMHPAGATIGVLRYRDETPPEQ